jgi:hypothetical protein
LSSEIHAWVQSAVQTTHFAVLSRSVPVVQGAGGSALPARQPHTPEEQIGALDGQTFPQKPQLLLSVVVLTSQPSA